jgi:hypothetical protein
LGAFADCAALVEAMGATAVDGVSLGVGSVAGTGEGVGESE